MRRMTQGLLLKMMLLRFTLVLMIAAISGCTESTKESSSIDGTNVSESLLKNKGGHDDIHSEAPSAISNPKGYHQYYLKKAQAGDAEAMFQVGTQHKDGWGVEQSMTKAFTWWKKAAEAGHVKSMSNVGFCYGEGKVVAQSYEEEMKWYKKAADLGGGLAMKNIAGMYYLGVGVTEDYDRAFQWASKAAKAGSRQGMELLSTMYRDGLGTESDPKAAKMWWRKAEESDFIE